MSYEQAVRRHLRRFLVGAGAVVVLAGCASSAKHSTSATVRSTLPTSALVTTTETPTTTTAPTTSTTTPGPGVGSTLTIANGATITLVSYGPVPAADVPPIGAKPGEVEVVVKGCSGSVAVSFNPLSFNLVDSENDKVQADLGGSKSQIDSGDVSPGDCVKGSVAFMLAPGLTAKALEFSNIGGAAQARWSLS